MLIIIILLSRYLPILGTETVGGGGRGAVEYLAYFRGVGVNLHWVWIWIFVDLVKFSPVVTTTLKGTTNKTALWLISRAISPVTQIHLRLLKNLWRRLFLQMARAIGQRHVWFICHQGASFASEFNAHKTSESCFYQTRKPKQCNHFVVIKLVSKYLWVGEQYL